MAKNVLKGIKSNGAAFEYQFPEEFFDEEQILHYGRFITAILKEITSK